MPDPGLIPHPVKIDRKPGFFELTADSAIAVDAGDESTLCYLRDLLAPATGFELPVRSGESTAAIALSRVDDTSLGREGYRLCVDGDQVRIQATAESGLFYAVQTLRQLLPAAIEKGEKTGGPWRIPLVEIEDRPRFAWRGMHLDVCRHFFPVAVVERLLDLLALHKFNVFHWHLTEDQGWRIEVPAYPRLTKVGAWRREKDGGTHGGFYTRDEMRHVVDYAAARHITILPEVEMPGHAQAVLAAHPELSCNGGPFEVWNDWGISEEVYCAGNEATFAFLEDVLDQVIDLFPGDYVHIGGDECPKARWRECPRCQQRIKDENLRDEDELQSYFIKRIAAFLQNRGKKLIGWDEILEGGLAADATVMSWRGSKGGLAAARAGNDVIMAPTTHVYFDYKHRDDPDDPGRLGVIPLEKVYSFEPVPTALTPAETQHILGAQANVWSEGMSTQSAIEQLVFPRLCALSEVIWSPPEIRDWPTFKTRLQTHGTRLQALDVNFYRDPELWP